MGKKRHGPRASEHKEGGSRPRLHDEGVAAIDQVTEGTNRVHPA